MAKTTKKQAPGPAAPAEIVEDFLPSTKLATVEFALEKVTATAARYEEIIVTREIKVGTIYIQKSTLPDPAPDKIRITIETI